MRTDVKIGIVVGLLVLGLVVVYFALLDKGPQTTPGPSPADKVANRVEPAPKTEAKSPKVDKKTERKTPPPLARKDDKKEEFVAPPFTERPVTPEPATPVQPPVVTPPTPTIPEPPVVTPPVLPTPSDPIPPVARRDPLAPGTDEVVTPRFGPGPRVETPPVTPPTPRTPGLPPRVIEEPVIPAPTPPTADQAREYTVVQGDAGYWTIAEKMYGAGKGSQWVHIAKANPQVASTALRPGMKLKVPPLPAASPVIPPRPDAGTITPGPGSASTGDGSPAPGPAGSTVYVVKEGDKGLWAIAEKLYGDGSLYSVIQKANPNVNSNALRVGQRLTVPPKPEAAPAATAGTAPAPGTTAPRTPATPRTPARRPVPDGRPIFVE